MKLYKKQSMIWCHNVAHSFDGCLQDTIDLNLDLRFSCVLIGLDEDFADAYIFANGS